MVFKEQLRTILADQLPGQEAHLEVVPFNRIISAEQLKTSGEYRESAVGILLFESNNSIHSILIQRPTYNGTHSNQIAFPGGKMDPTDIDLEFTARRECKEEINIPHDKGELLGSLTSVYIPVSGFKVQPHLFFLDSLPELVPDPREVDQILTFDIFDLLKDNIIQKTDIQLTNGVKQKDVPYFAIEDKIVWGATAMMLSELRAILRKF